MRGPTWVRCWRGEWCVRLGNKNPKGSKMDGKMNISDEKFDFARSKKQTTGNSINYY
jgi:hypothetical protein